jgi:hypothetical protein
MLRRERACRQINDTAVRRNVTVIR